MTSKRALNEKKDAKDSIDLLLADWARERPDLDPWAFEISGRLWRASSSVLKKTEDWLSPLGLTFESFSVIVTLRRSGHPFQMNPTALYRHSLLSSGAMTNRIDRVENAGLVVRRADPNDRRGTLVQLTAKGRKLADRAIAIHFEKLAELLSPLSLAERAQLSTLLTKVAVALEE